jgi:hypothetical protein
MAVESSSMIMVVGIDIGGVILDYRDRSQYNRSGVDEREFSTVVVAGGASGEGGKPFRTAAVEGAFEGIAQLVATLGADRVHIVSKAGKSMQEAMLQWLAAADFWGSTGFLRENTHFCLERPQKRTICELYSITHFVDDRTDVLQCLAGPGSPTGHLFLFGATPQKIVAVTAHIPPAAARVFTPQSWKKLVALLLMEHGRTPLPQRA